MLNCKCLCSWLPVHIMGFCSMQATCGQLAVDITAHTKTWGKPLGDRVLPRLYCFNRGIAWVSLCVSLLACRRPREEKEKNSNRTAPYSLDGCQDNEISQCCKVSLLVVHYIAFRGLEPLSRQKSAHMKNSSTLLPVSHIFFLQCQTCFCKW